MEGNDFFAVSVCSVRRDGLYYVSVDRDICVKLVKTSN